MALLIVFYALIILALVGIAIYEHITISTLSLPISPGLTILTILLPILSPFTTLSTRYLNRPNSNNRKLTHPSSTRPPRPHRPTLTTLTTLAPILRSLPHLAQFTLTIALTTLYASQLTSPVTSCLLSQKWLSFWKSHDAAAIRAIQDALTCCGFRSTRDMAWPFPGGRRPDKGLCEAQFGRREPCLPAWESAMRRAVGGEIGVVVAVGALQVLVMVLAGRGGMGWAAGLERFWSEGFNGVGGGREGVEGSRRPLLAAAEEGGVEDEAGYRQVVDEEDEGYGQRHEGDEVGQRTVTGGYGGAAGGGPRVEPAHHGPWADA